MPFTSFEQLAASVIPADVLRQLLANFAPGDWIVAFEPHHVINRKPRWQCIHLKIHVASHPSPTPKPISAFTSTKSWMPQSAYSLPLPEFL